MIYVYDGSFDGFLTTVFYGFEQKQEPLRIVSIDCWQATFFDVEVHIVTDTVKSERVWKGIVRYSNEKVARMVYHAFASDISDIERSIFCYLQKLFADKTRKFYQNLLDENSLTIYQTARKVKGETHRFLGIVRFQETLDGMFFSLIDPDHDIVGLLAPHFSRRFADRPWVIYDRKRDKGIYYDGKEVQEIILTEKQFDSMTGSLPHTLKADDEDQDRYRELWKVYYQSINIAERKNTRLLLRNLPRRYWKYLPERQEQQNVVSKEIKGNKSQE